MIGGGLFGVPGMIVGVPIFAVLNAAVWKLIGRSLDKEMSADAEFYRNTTVLIRFPEKHFQCQ